MDFKSSDQVSSPGRNLLPVALLLRYSVLRLRNHSFVSRYGRNVIHFATGESVRLAIRKGIFFAEGGKQTGELANRKQIKQTQDEPQWIVAQRLLSALTIPGFS